MTEHDPQLAPAAALPTGLVPPVDAVQELEAKFLTTPDRGPQIVLRRVQETLAWAGFRIQPVGRRHMDDTYYDTADQQLRSGGWSFRQRRDAAGRRLALKELNRSRAAIFDRREIEQPLHAGAAEHGLNTPPPGPVQERLVNLLQPGATVVPLFTVHSRRATFRLSHPEHPGGLVQMAFDESRIESKDNITFTELELELKSGTHEMLASILAAVELEPALVDARLSKYERGLMAAGCPLSRRSPVLLKYLRRDSRWLDVAIAHLKAQLAQLRLYEPYAWEGIHVEGVHQMRVATRRAHAALRIFAEVLPETETRRLLKDIRWLAGKLGAVRDLDVHLSHLATYRNSVKPFQQGLLARYEAHLKALHHKAHGELVRALADDTYVTLIAEYRALLAAAGRPSNAHSLRVEEAAHASVGPLLDAVYRRGRAINDKTPAKRLHRLRIDVKRLRYQLEYLQDAYAGDLDVAVAALRALQERLGLHQDAWVARNHLEEYRSQRAMDKPERRVMKQLIGLEKHNARRQHRRFFKSWQRFEAASENLLERL